MPRRSKTFQTQTPLGAALLKKREGLDVREAGEKSGVNYSTLARLERGEGTLSAATALKLATWLGWSVEQVIRGALPPSP